MEGLVSCNRCRRSISINRMRRHKEMRCQGVPPNHWTPNVEKPNEWQIIKERENVNLGIRNARNSSN